MLPPLTTHRSPLTTSQPRPGRRPNSIIERVEEHAEEEVEHQDADKGNHKRLRGGPAYSLGAGGAVEAAVAAHNRDHAAKKHRLDQAHPDVPHADIIARGCPVVVCVNL